MPQAEGVTLGHLPSPAPRRAMLVLLGALTAFGPMSLDLYLPAFESIAEDLKVPVSALGLTFSASLLGLGIGQLFYGPLSDRFGRKRPLLLGLSIFVLASIACTLAPNIFALVAFRFLQALGGSAGIVLARAMIRDQYSGKDLARILSLVAMVFGLAPVLAPTIGALLLRLGSWRIVFLALALFGAICFSAVSRINETLPLSHRVPHSITGALGNYIVVFRESGFRAPAFVAALSSMGLFAYISSSPRMYLTEFDLTPQQFGLAFGTGALAFVVGAQVNARLVRKSSIRTLLLVYLLIQVLASAVGIVAMRLGAPVVALVLILAIYQACTGGITGNALSEALGRFSVLVGTAAAVIGIMQLGSSSFVSAGLALIPLAPAALLTATLMLFSTAALLIVATTVGRYPRVVEKVDTAPS